MELDRHIFIVLNNLFDSPGWELFFGTVTQLGNGFVLALVIVPSLWLLKRVELKKHLIFMAIFIALGGLVVSGIKIVVGRERPGELSSNSKIIVNTPLGTPNDHSFPSGHTQTAFGAAAYMSCVFPTGTPIFTFLAALVGLSRVALGVHYPSDVIVGALIGVLFAVSGFQLNIYRLGRRNRPSRP